MAGFFRDWLHNLWVTVAAVVVVGILMVIFMKIFYPETLGIMSLSGQFAVGLISTLKWWPLVILAIIISAFPRRRRR